MQLNIKNKIHAAGHSFIKKSNLITAAYAESHPVLKIKTIALGVAPSWWLELKFEVLERTSELIEFNLSGNREAEYGISGARHACSVQNHIIIRDF